MSQTRDAIELKSGLWHGGLTGAALLVSGLLLACAESQLRPAPPPPAPTVAPVRIVRVHDAEATDSFAPQPHRVEPMFDRALTNLTQTSNVIAAWRSLVSTQDVVGIKVFSAPGPTGGTRIAVVEAAVRSLLRAGLPTNQIIVWDEEFALLRRAGYTDLAKRLGIRVVGAAERGFDDDQFYESSLLGKLVWGDHEFGKTGDRVGRRSFVSKLVTQEITRIVSIAPLLNHNLAGVSGHLYGLALGSVDNRIRFESDEARLAQAIPEIYALPILGDRVVLNVTDALLCQYYGEEDTLLHYTNPMDELWLSRDPVALDMLAMSELDRTRPQSKAPARRHGKELYENAELLEIGRGKSGQWLVQELR